MHLDQFALPGNGLLEIYSERTYFIQYRGLLLAILAFSLAALSRAQWLEYIVANSAAHGKFEPFRGSLYSSASNSNN
ncbi:MAG: hypothetical protein N3G20_01640, partial [Verrucomicrobiae bacterium]|nr:hypothetical protein [Verrucomicrobiae bacterium]